MSIQNGKQQSLSAPLLDMSEDDFTSPDPFTKPRKPKQMKRKRNPARKSLRKWKGIGQLQTVSIPLKTLSCSRLMYLGDSNISGQTSILAIFVQWILPFIICPESTLIATIQIVTARWRSLTVFASSGQLRWRLRLARIRRKLARLPLGNILNRATKPQKQDSPWAPKSSSRSDNFGASKVRDALLDEGFSKADLPPVKQVQIYLNSKKSQVHPATTLKGFKTNSPKWDQCMQGKVMIFLFLLCMQGNSQWNSIFLICWWWRNKWKEATM